MKSKTERRIKADNLEKPLGSGKSSLDRIDVEAFFKELRLRRGSAFLDIARGRGAYLLAVAGIIGPAGTLYGVGLWQEGISSWSRPLLSFFQAGGAVGGRLSATLSLLIRPCPSPRLFLIEAFDLTPRPC